MSTAPFLPPLYDVAAAYAQIRGFVASQDPLMLQVVRTALQLSEGIARQVRAEHPDPATHREALLTSGEALVLGAASVQVLADDALAATMCNILGAAGYHLMNEAGGPR